MTSTNTDNNTDSITDAHVIALALTAADIDPEQGYQTVPAAVLADQHHPLVEVRLPLVVTHFASVDLAAVATTLQHAYPGEHRVTWVSGSDRPHVETLPLNQLPETPSLEPWSSLCVPPLPQGGSLSDLLEIVAHLPRPTAARGIASRP